MRRGTISRPVGALLAAGAVVAGVLAAGGGAGTSATRVTPVRLQFACALKSNGLLRYVSALSGCKQKETAVTVSPGPTYVCVRPGGSSRLVASPGRCRAGHPSRRLVRLPPLSGTVWFCAKRTTGILRYVASAARCKSSEVPVFVNSADVAPSVTSTSPANGATRVGVDENVVVTFSESVGASAASFSLECPSGTPRAFTVGGSPGSSITLDPTASLPENTACVVKVIASQISDTDTLDPPDHMAADYSFGFTTDAAPSVTATSPANGATAVATSTNVVVTFSESVTASAGSFTLACPGGTPQAFAASGSPGATITLDPSSDLPAGTTCTVSVLASQVSDTDTGDPPDHPAANYVFSFTTASGGGGGGGDAAPTVTTTTPSAGALHIAIDTDITVDFSESVTASGSSFTLGCPTGTPQAVTVSGSPGSTITLDPTGDLPAGTICTVTVIADQISDTDSVDPPDHMAADYVFSFTADAAPTVTTTSPADGATAVDPSANIVASFSEPVTATGGSFTLECPTGSAQSFAVSGSGTATITLNPSADLPDATVCTVTVLAAGISDVDSGDPPDHPAANTVFSFTTADAAPSVTSTTPADGADHVAIDTNITVDFSESVTASGSSFTLECPTGTPEPVTVSGSPGTGITLDPNSDLPAGTICTVTVLANQISDVDTVDPPDHMAADYVFAFTTDAVPVITASSPANGASGVDPSTNIAVTFSEPVTATAGSFTLECPTGTPQAFAVSGSGSSTITLNPNADLPAATVCTVTVLAAGISDVDSGDPPDHPAANTVFSFTTADAAPSVTSTTPADGADHVAIDTNVTVNFSEPVTASGSSFTLECPTGTPEPFTVSGSPGTGITLDPNSDLPAGTICTVTVLANQISDVDSVDPPDHMAANYVFSFTTDAAPLATASSPVDGATGVDPATNITVTFSEPVTAGGSSFTLECPTGTPQAFTVSGSGTATITLNPNVDLPSATVCTVTVLAAGISDVDTGDPPDHPATNAVIAFTTADAAPSVTSTTPTNGAVDVARDANIGITFSEPVTASGSSFTLECPTGTPQPVTVSGSPGTTITLDPNADLPKGAICTVTVIADQISDVDTVDPPDHMAANYVFSFTVVANRAPTNIGLSPSSVPENEPVGTTVGTFSTTDPDVGDTFTYSLVSGTGSADNGSFTIAADTLKTNAVFDFETKSSYSIRVRTTDNDGAFFEKALTISVTNVNEAPTAVDDSSSTDEDTAKSLDPRTNDTDPDAGDTLTVVAVGTPDNGGSVAITGGGTGVQFTPGASFQDLNVGQSRVSHFTYTIQDSGGLQSTATVTMTVTGLNDAPVAVADTFNGSNSALAGVTLAVGTSPSAPHVSITGSVLDNDTDVDTPHGSLTASAGASTTNGGTLAMSSNGNFTYTPAPGFVGDDTFSYTVHDNATPDLTSSTTATIHVVGPRVWFVNPGGASGNGTSPTPFSSLAPLTTGGASDSLDGTGDVIFVYQGSGNAASAGFVLEANQTLVGQPQGLTVTDSLSRTFNLVAAGGSNPTITNGGGAGITLADGNTIQRVNVTGASGAGVTGSGIGTLTYGPSTTISGNAGGGVLLDGAASGNISIAAGITGSAGHSVFVGNRSGGTVAFSGAISDTGTGVSLGSNTGATINFTGGVTASTGANNAFSATGGGTVNVTGSSNTLATTTGTALNVSSTNIGASGLIFQGISSNGAVDGIVLSSTGASGGLTVSGTGSAGSGGTITGSTNAGILLSSTSSPSFSWMNVQNGGDDGIRGTSVSGLTLSNMNVSGNGNAVGERGMEFTALTGTATIGSSTFTGSAEDNAIITNSSGSLNLTVTGSTFSNTSTATGNDGIHLDANDTAGISASITGSTFNHNRGDHFQFSTNTSATGASSVTFSNNTLTGDRGSTHGGTDLGGGVTISTEGSSDTTFTLSNNNVQGAVDSALKVDLGTNSTAGATLSGTISGNTIGTAATADSGSAQTNGISATLQGQGTETVSITNNVIRQYNLNGINIFQRLGAATENATITGNTVGNPGAFALNGILVNAGASSTGNGGNPDAGTVCAAIGGAGALANSITGAGTNGADPTATDFRLRQRFNTTVKLPGYGGAAGDTAAVVTFVKNNNGGTPTGSATVNFPAGGGGFVGGAACPTP